MDKVNQDCVISDLMDQVQQSRDTHAEMMAKLRELSLQWRELSEAAHKDGEFDRSNVWEDASRRLEKLLSTEPADPVKVDLSAVRQVMGELRLQPYIDKDHDQCVRWANRLATAIGDTP